MLTIAFGFKVSVSNSNKLAVSCDFTEEMMSLPPKILLQLIAASASLLQKEISTIQSESLENKTLMEGEYLFATEITGDVGASSHQYIGMITNYDKVALLPLYQQLMLLSAAKAYLLNSGTQVVMQCTAEPA